MRALRAPALALALILAAAPAAAQDGKDPRAEVERLAREAAEKLMAALAVMLRSIPQYEMPEVLPNGDIIIRRKHPPPEPPPPPNKRPPEGAPDQTET